MRFRSLGKVFLLPLGLLATSALAQTTLPAQPILDNMDFERGEIGKPPPGWWGRSAITSDDRPQGGAKSLLLRNGAGPFASFGRTVPAAPFRGQYIRFQAAVRTTSSDGAGLWLRIDGPKRGGPRGAVLFLDNMSNRPVRSPDWTWAEIKIDVPPDAEQIVFGGIVFGVGTAGFDSASLDLLPASVDPTTPQAQAYLDRALDILQARHLNRHRVDWPTLRSQAHAAAAHAQTPADTYKAIWLAIGELGEKHTLLLPPGADIGSIAAGPHPVPLEAKVLGDKVVELRLPGTGDPIGATYIATLRTAIAQHRRMGACGWIIDLRDDGGGAVQPMLTGLAPLLGPPPWSGSQDADGALQISTLRGGVFSYVPVRAFPKSSRQAASALAPVAVLIGPRTASAGEMTALAFAGRPNERSFGASTAGLTTGNVLVGLSDGAALVLTVNHALDRTGQLVEGPLQADQPTAPELTEAAALDWLGDKGCR